MALFVQGVAQRSIDEDPAELFMTASGEGPWTKQRP
jgi:hypothetical protein